MKHAAVCWIIAVAGLAPLQSSAARPQTVREALPAVESIEIITPRTMEEVETDRENLSELRKRVQGRAGRARELHSKAVTNIDIKEKESELLGSRIDSAENARNAAEEATLEAEQTIAERVLDVFTAEKELREAELEALQAEEEYLEAAEGVLEVEKELVRKRAEREKAMAGSSPSTLNALIRELESRILDAQIAAGERQRASVEKATSVLRRKQELLEAQNRLRTGGE